MTLVDVRKKEKEKKTFKQGSNREHDFKQDKIEKINSCD